MPEPISNPSPRTLQPLLADTLIPLWETNRKQVEQWDRWYRGKHDQPVMPKGPTREFKELQARSVSPWLALVVTGVAQQLYVEGYRRRDSAGEEPAWTVWQRNQMDARQAQIHRGAAAHGIAYATVLPGDPLPVIRGVSARKMVAFYQDPAEDEWPMYALRGDSLGDNKIRFRLYDDERVWTFDSADGNPTYVEFQEHNVGQVPVIRYSNMLDLDGRSTGEVEPFIPLASRIDQDTFDRLVVQRFGAWVVRYIAGMAKPETDEQERAQALMLRVSDLLVSPDSDTKFGTLAGTPLEGYIKSRDADIRDLAALSQTPPHYLLGTLVNLSAEALSAAESALTRKVVERQHSFGESHEQMLRLAAHVGRMDGADDFDAQVRWRDMESRSLSQVADALGKLATMLGVPPQALWERIPGTTQQDVERWTQMRLEDDTLDRILAAVDDSLAQ